MTMTEPLDILQFPPDFVEWAEGPDHPEVKSLGMWPAGEWVFEMQNSRGDRRYRFSVTPARVTQAALGWERLLAWETARGRLAIRGAG
jgi:hypothetical protein